MVLRDTPNILRRIAEVKRLEVERLKVDVPIRNIEKRIEAQSNPLNLAGTLFGDSVRIIAEVKRASPTAGVLRADFDVAYLASEYADNGAAAISVLTEEDHFRGSIDHLQVVQAAVYPRGIPVLRKDFIFDPYQVHESRAFGADAILLIVAMLTPKALRDLMELAQSFWMQCLVEIHDEDDLSVALDVGAEIVGINNRNLRTFKTDLGVTERLAPMIPTGKIIVSESGICERKHIQRVERAGVHAALVGQALVTAKDPGVKLRELV